MVYSHELTISQKEKKVPDKKWLAVMAAAEGGRKSSG